MDFLGFCLWFNTDMDFASYHTALAPGKSGYGLACYFQS